MALTDPQATPFFHRGPRPVTRYTFFALLSLTLLALDGQLHLLKTVRQGLAIVIYPLEQAAQAPLEIYHQVNDFFVTQAQLKTDNTALRVRHLKDAAELQRLTAIQNENRYLRQLLGAQQKPHYTSTLAEVKFAREDPFRRRIEIDRGALHGIRLGAPVIDDVGVVGQITQLMPLASEVTLLTDKDQTVPVELARTGQRGVLFGVGNDLTLELRFMPVSSDIQAGDVLVTSGLDGVYPRGIPVARVTKVGRPAELAFAMVTATPLAGIGRRNEVLVLEIKPGVAAPPVRAPAQKPAEEAKPNNAAAPATAAAPAKPQPTSVAEPPAKPRPTPEPVKPAAEPPKPKPVAVPKPAAEPAKPKPAPAEDSGDAGALPLVND